MIFTCKFTGLTKALSEGSGLLSPGQGPFLTQSPPPRPAQLPKQRVAAQTVLPQTLTAAGESGADSVGESR